MNIRSYEELSQIESFLERFEYLKLSGSIGKETFGHSRYINQILYHSYEWLEFRDKIIIRDNGCNLGVEGYEIKGSIIIHHINPITIDDILNRNPCVFDMDNAISTDLITHNAIHYGDRDLLILPPMERQKYDTCPWRKM